MSALRPVRTIAGEPARALALLAVSLLPFAFFLIAFPATADQDAAMHAIYAIHPDNLARVFSVWSRPAFAVPYLLPAHFGYLAMRATTVLLCAATAWLTYRTAARLGLRFAWLAIPLVLLQPVLLPVGVDTMTEPAFAIILAAGLLLLAHERRAHAAVILSFLPLARPEGPFVLAVIALAWLPRAIRDAKEWLPIVLLATGMIVWEASVTILAHDPHFLQGTFPWSTGGAIHFVNPPLHYVRRAPHILGIGTLALWLLGLASWRQRPFVRLAVAITMFVLLVHSYLFATGSLGSTGFDRYFASVTPLTAIVALAGVGTLMDRAPRAALRIAIAALVLDAAQGMIAMDSNPYNHMPSATLEMARLAAPHVHAGTHVLSADHFGYLFLGVDDTNRLPIADQAGSIAVIDTLPVGTVVLWDNVTGDWWYHLSAGDFTSRRYRVLSARRLTLESPLGEYYHRAATSRLGWLYYAFGNWPVADVQQTLLVRQ